MFKKIMAFYDLSDPSWDALETAVKIAKQFQSTLTVVHVLDTTLRLPGLESSILAEALSKKVREEIEQELRDLSALPGLPQEETVKIPQGKIVPTLLRTIVLENPDLVVMGTHGRTGLARVRLGSVAEKISRFSTSPLLMVKNAKKWPAHKILVPLDISNSPEEILMHTSELISVLPAQVDLLHVLSYPEFVSYASESLLTPDVLDRQILEKYAQDKLKEIPLVHPSLKANTHSATGPVGDAICQKAEELGSELTIIMTHGKKGLNRLLMGSVAEYVIRYSSVNVLSICPHSAVKERKNYLQLEEL